MPRKRMIDPSFWRDEKIADCTHIERLMYIGLWNFAEDHGVGRANPKLIKADIFPYDTLRDSDIEKAIAHLAEIGLIVLYQADSQNYYYIPNFKKHQTINKPTPPTLPLPDECSSDTVVLPPNRREEKLIDTCANSFADFWKVYPKKKSKGDAEKAFKAINPNSQLLGAIIAAVEEQKLSRDWTKDNGQFIPYPATWLRAKGWEDEGPDEIGAKWREL